MRKQQSPGSPGFNIVAIPCDDFGGEPADNAAIKDYVARAGGTPVGG